MSAIHAQAAETVPELTLGWRLQMALHHGNLRAWDMADILQVSRQTLTRWMHDLSVPRWLDLQAWAQVCGVSLDWLAGDDVAPPAALIPVPKRQARSTPKVSGGTTPKRRRGTRHISQYVHTDSRDHPRDRAVA